MHELIKPSLMKPYRVRTIIIPVLWMGNRNANQLSNLPRATQLVSGRAEVQMQQNPSLLTTTVCLRKCLPGFFGK